MYEKPSESLHDRRSLSNAPHVTVIRLAKNGVLPLQSFPLKTLQTFLYYFVPLCL